MCGRYYVDEETAREIERIVRHTDCLAGNGLTAGGTGGLRLRAGDIFPTDTAPVLSADGERICCRWQRWGFPPIRGKQVLINARSETALERPVFQDSVQTRRVVVPAAWFYEWSRDKEKNIFFRKNQPVLFMAGIYSRFEEEERFVILTTAANEAVSPVHDRMPLVLEEEEIGAWLLNAGRTGELLAKRPGPVERRTEFEQMSLF